MCEFWGALSWGNLTELGFGSLEGCKIVAGGRRPPERNSIDCQHPEGVQEIDGLRLTQFLAPLQGAKALRPDPTQG